MAPLVSPPWNSPRAPALNHRIITLTLGIAFAWSPLARAESYQFDALEASFDATYANSLISLAGIVTNDENDAPLSGVLVEVIGFGSGSSTSTTSNASGVFSVAGLRRRSVLLKISRSGFYSEIVALDLHRPTTELLADLGTVRLRAKKAGRVRLAFVGDTMFGRRFADADEDGTQGEAGDLIRPATRAADSRAIVQFVREVTLAADYAVANLECAVTANPATPHPFKSFTFYSHPNTLAGLTHAGFDALDLANNHIFDYLTQGVEDTLDALDAHSLAWTGAGLNETMAKASVLEEEFSDVPFSLLGFTPMITDGTNNPNFSLVARDPAKAGALESSIDNRADFLMDAGGRFAIGMLHGGTEYSSYPSNGMRALFVDLVEQGAGLVVGHHPHSLHGIGLVEGDEGPRFVIMSLGNFLFDQDRFVTTQSMIAIADVETTPGGFTLDRLELVPLHRESYVPALVAGEWRARAGRQLGHLSTTLPSTPSGSGTADGLTGAVVFPAGHRVLAVHEEAQAVVSDTADSFSASLSGGSTGALLYERTGGPADSLRRVQTNATAQLELGREILLYGDFEDLDVDDAYSEGHAWNQSDSRYLENSVVRGGNGAVVLLRKSTNSGNTTMTNFRRVPVTAGTRLTLTGWIRGDNAGQLRISTRFVSSGGNTVSTTDRVSKAAGNYSWTPFTANFTVPSGAAELELRFRHSPPGSGEGRVFIDDVSLIAWERSFANANGGVTLATPNNWSFLRFTASGTNLGVTLTHRTYQEL